MAPSRSLAERILFERLFPAISFVGALALGFYAFISSEPTVKTFLHGLVPGKSAVHRAAPSGASGGAGLSATPAVAASPRASRGDLAAVDRSDVTLYLPARTDPDHLQAFPATIDAGLPLRDGVARVLAMLAEPPAPDALPTVPKTTRLLSLYVSGKSAWVNLSRELLADHPGGTTACRMTVYSLVNTLVEMGVGDDIRLLVAGREPSSFLDHVDLSRPFGFEESVMRRSPGGGR